MKHITFSDSQKLVTGQLATSSVEKGPNCCFLSFSEGTCLSLLPQPFCWIYHGAWRKQIPVKSVMQISWFTSYWLMEGAGTLHWYRLCYASKAKLVHYTRLLVFIDYYVCTKFFPLTPLSWSPLKTQSSHYSFYASSVLCYLFCQSRVTRLDAFTSVFALSLFLSCLLLC